MKGSVSLSNLVPPGPEALSHQVFHPAAGRRRRPCERRRHGWAHSYNLSADLPVATLSFKSGVWVLAAAHRFLTFQNSIHLLKAFPRDRTRVSLQLQWGLSIGIAAVSYDSRFRAFPSACGTSTCGARARSWPRETLAGLEKRSLIERNAFWFRRSAVKRSVFLLLIFLAPCAARGACRRAFRRERRRLRGPARAHEVRWLRNHLTAFGLDDAQRPTLGMSRNGQETALPASTGGLPCAAFRPPAPAACF